MALLFYLKKIANRDRIGNLASKEQNFITIVDSLGICKFACTSPLGLSMKKLAQLLESITGIKRTADDLFLIGERIFNLEKMFNFREGFRRRDDNLPERFFNDALTIGSEKGAVLDKKEFTTMLTEYYQERNWDLESSKPKKAKLAQLGLEFTAT